MLARLALEVDEVLRPRAPVRSCARLWGRVRGARHLDAPVLGHDGQPLVGDCHILQRGQCHLPGGEWRRFGVGIAHAGAEPGGRGGECADTVLDGEHRVVGAPVGHARVEGHRPRALPADRRRAGGRVQGAGAALDPHDGLGDRSVGVGALPRARRALVRPRDGGVSAISVGFEDGHGPLLRPPQLLPGLGADDVLARLVARRGVRPLPAARVARRARAEEVAGAGGEARGPGLRVHPPLEHGAGHFDRRRLRGGGRQGDGRGADGDGRADRAQDFQRSARPHTTTAFPPGRRSH